MQNEHKKFMAIALEEAKLGLREGGIPIGSALVLNNEVVGRGLDILTYLKEGDS